MREHALDGRLSSVGRLVREGALLADVGTDHAYLPLFLLRSGRIRGAVCSDINAAPLESAKQNARAAGLIDRCRFLLTDGAAELAGLGVTDVAIAGMGGELIADIIERAPFLRDTGIRLILQPMSRQAHLRRYLAASGFEIFAEEYSHSAGKFYLTLGVSFTGRVRDIDCFEAEFGEARFLEVLSDEARGYLRAKARVLQKIARGKDEGKESSGAEAALYEYAIKILGKCHGENL